MANRNWPLLIQHWLVHEMRVIKSYIFVALMLSAIAAPALAADSAVVAISNFTFSPAAIKIHPGDSLTFRNDDDIPHQVIANDGSFKSKALDTGDTSVFTFKTAGEFGYFCGLHPHMVGKVIVAP